jgi:D-alanine-D-alanine ligase
VTPHRVLLLCGGRSEEHEVSLASARSLLAAADPRVTWLTRVIDRDGRWLDAAASAARLAAGGRPAPARIDGWAGTLEERLDLAAFAGVDAVFPLLHGPFGEDGRLQGVLEVLGVPYVGAGVLGGAVGMDKWAMKALFAAAGLPIVAYQGVREHEWRSDRSGVERDLDALGEVVFVKPANLGSSIGIRRAVGAEERAEAIEEALAFDRRVVVERAAVGVRELEVGVLGNDDPAVSVVGEIVAGGEPYDFERKYTPGGAALSAPADLPADVAAACQAMARRAFVAVDAAGLARVDFFYRESDGGLWVNEINTMPGFTATSMYPRVWEVSGLGYADLAVALVDLALQRASGGAARYHRPGR